MLKKDKDNIQNFIDILSYNVAHQYNDDSESINRNIAIISAFKAILEFDERLTSIEVSSWRNKR